MSEPHSIWHTPRKIWHISATLAMLPIFFIAKLLFPVYWPAILIILVWSILISLIVVDLIRMYYPDSNDFILSLPLLSFFRTIWRSHEITGYAASTYSVLAMAVIMTLLYLNLIGEQVLIVSIIVMAFCDPAASLTRFQLNSWSPLIKRLISFLIFVGSCFLILVAVGWFYQSVNFDRLLAAALAGAFCEVYISKLWHLAVKVWKKYFLAPQLPLWIANIYFDDNLTVPLALVLVLMILGY